MSIVGKTAFLPGYDDSDSDTIHSLEIPVIKVARPGKPRMIFFVVPADENSCPEVNLEIVSYASMKDLSPELRKMVSEELRKK